MSTPLLSHSKLRHAMTVCHYKQPTCSACGHTEPSTFNQCDGARERGQSCGERYWRVVQRPSKECPQCAAKKQADESATKMRNNVRSLWGVYLRATSKIRGELNKAKSSMLLKVLSSKGNTNADSANRSGRSKKRLVIFHVTYWRRFLKH